MLPCALPRLSCVWQFSAPFVSLHLSSSGRLVGDGKQQVENGERPLVDLCGGSVERPRIACLSWSSDAQLGTLKTPPLPQVVKA